MQFSLVICTYMRVESLMNLLNSVSVQTKYPNEILIVDGSTDNRTQVELDQQNYRNLKYFKVKPNQRGLTKQRNYGISKVSNKSEVICFLDDDTVLEKKYFEQIIETFKSDLNITGVGGVAINENRWVKKELNRKYNSRIYFEIDDFVVKEGIRNIARNYLGLQSTELPGRMPDFSHGRTCGYPLNGKNYAVDLLIGMSFSFKRHVFENIKFSIFFEGYGLYEDADFSIRALNFGQNVICTSAKLYHYHDASGRPNQFKYGKMVARNGWYVWRLKYPNPGIQARIKWHLTFLLLMKLRFLNGITGPNRFDAFTEGIGRLMGWLSLFFNSPRIKSN